MEKYEHALSLKLRTLEQGMWFNGQMQSSHLQSCIKGQRLIGKNCIG